MPDEAAVPYEEIPEHFRRTHAQDFERLEKLESDIGPHLARFKNQGVEIMFTLPGHPANGYDLFCQPRDGVPMARLAMKEKVAFLWFSREGKWSVRRWMEAPFHEDSQIVPCETLLAAVREIETT